MAEIIKKASILTRLKHIVTKTKRRFSWRSQIKDDVVTALDASDIQQDVYNHSQNIRHNVYTPPYMELAAQLLVHEQQIFEAAANHLITIAKSRRKYTNEIKYHGIPNCDFISKELDLLNWADMHINIKGEYVTFEERLQDIKSRRGENAQAYINSLKIINLLRAKGYD